MLVTRVVDGEPDHLTRAPLPSVMPVVSALSTSGMIIACVFTPWGLPAGGVLVGLALAAWFWPTDTRPGFLVRDRIAEESAHREELA